MTTRFLMFLFVCCTRDRDWNPLTIEIQNPSCHSFGNIWTWQCWSDIYFWTWQCWSDIYFWTYQPNTGTYLRSSWRGLILFTNSWTLFPSCCLPILDLPSTWKRQLICPKKIIKCDTIHLHGRKYGWRHQYFWAWNVWYLLNLSI